MYFLKKQNWIISYTIKSRNYSQLNDGNFFLFILCLFFVKLQDILVPLDKSEISEMLMCGHRWLLCFINIVNKLSMFYCCTVCLYCTYGVHGVSACIETGGKLGGVRSLFSHQVLRNNHRLSGFSCWAMSPSWHQNLNKMVIHSRTGSLKELIHDNVSY